MGPNGHVETVAAHKLPYAKPLDGIEDLLVDIGDESNIALLGFDNNFCEVKRADDWQVWLGPIRLVKVRIILLPCSLPSSLASTVLSSPSGGTGRTTPSTASPLPTVIRRLPLSAVTPVHLLPKLLHAIR